MFPRAGRVGRFSVGGGGGGLKSVGRFSGGVGGGLKSLIALADILGLGSVLVIVCWDGRSTMLICLVLSTSWGVPMTLAVGFSFFSVLSLENMLPTLVFNRSEEFEGGCVAQGSKGGDVIC